MAVRKCSLAECHAPDSFCVKTATPEYQNCTHFLKTSADGIQHPKKRAKTTAIPWSGQAFYPEDIHLVSHRSSPTIIGLVGSAKAGKTTYLALLYTLLFNNRRVNNWSFAGSYTFKEWELQAKSLQIKDSGKISATNATPSTPDYYSLYHLALRNNNQLSDVLFADSSGEVFTKWSENVEDPAAENAQWIYENSNSFFFFVDCEAIVNKKGRAKKDILQLAEQISNNIAGRPIVIIWSKAEIIDDILPNIKTGIEQRLSILFPEAAVLKVSKFSVKASDDLFYQNNLKAVELVLNQILSPRKIKLEQPEEATEDYFLKYRGRYGTE